MMRIKWARAENDEAERHLSPRGPTLSPDNQNLLDIGKPRPLFYIRMPRAGGSILAPAQRRRLLAALDEERAHGRIFLFSPVVAGAGALAWFSASAQPSLVYLFGLLAASFGAFLVCRQSNRRLAGCAAMMSLLIFGAVLAGLETARSATIILDRPVTTTVIGTVIAREAAGNGRWRYELSLTETRDPTLYRMPPNIAIFVRDEEPVAIGEFMEGRARLSPPSGPALPGLTDFAFQSYFSGIGATGFLFGRPTVTAAPDLDPWHDLLSRFHAGRAAIGDRIRSVIGGDEGAFAAALVTNEQRALSPETMEVLRLSGLAHIIAISGMNMALAAGLSFIGLRSLLVLSVGLAQSLPVKKIAAVGAILTVSAYYTISGFAVSAERAYIMMVIMLVAVLFDRPAISMRNIALSAWIILITSPDALAGASFQMSYAGTIGLVAGYEFWTRHAPTQPMPGLPIPRFVRMLGRVTMAAVVTSAIGGSATALFSLVHFQRLATFGLVANVLVTPLLSLLVMPMLILAMLLMPLGLDTYPLLAMGWGLRWIIDIGAWVAAWNGQWLPGQLPPWFFASASLGLVLTALIRSSLRLVGVALLGGSCVLLAAWPAAPDPDFLLFEDGTLAAFVEADTLSVNSTRPPDFIFGQWQRALRREAFEKAMIPPEPTDVRHDDRADRYRPLTDQEEVAERVFLDAVLESLPERRFACKKSSWCVAHDRRGGTILVVVNRIYTGLACDIADLVIADLAPKFTSCRSGALLITGETLRRTGALTMRFTGDPRRPELTATFASLDRPWQSFRAYDWRNRRQIHNLPEHIRSLLADAPAPPTARDTLPPEKGKRHSVIATNEAYELPLDLDAVGGENAGLVGRVSGLQRNRRPFSAESLQRGFLVIHEGHDDIAGCGAGDIANDHGITIEDTGFDHRVALDLQCIMLTTAEHFRRHGDFVGIVLDRRNGNASGNAAHDRNGDRIGIVGRLRRRPCLNLSRGLLLAQTSLYNAGRKAAHGPQARRISLRQFDDFERARPVRQASDEATLFKRCDQPVNAGL